MEAESEKPKEKYADYRIKEVPVNIREGETAYSAFFPQIKSRHVETQGKWWKKKEYVFVYKWNFIYKKKYANEEYMYLAEGEKEDDYMKNRWAILICHSTEEANAEIEKVDVLFKKEKQKREEKRIKEIEFENRMAETAKIHEVK